MIGLVVLYGVCLGVGKLVDKFLCIVNFVLLYLMLGNN